MARTIDRSSYFVLEAFDRTVWCAIAQAPLRIADIDTLRTILGLTAHEDTKLELTYQLDDEQVGAIISAFDCFDPRQIGDANLAMSIFRWPPALFEVPYLVHTNYELPLLLDGRKKLARMSHCFPPDAFEGEERFDHWVANGFLYREEVVEPFEKPVGGLRGHRTVYYTPRGEEWRIAANKLVWQASEKSGGWNEHFERLDGMLLGYEDWQNDWWIKYCLEKGAFGGAAYYCAVTSAGLAWTESSGFRALPPIETSLLLRSWRATSDADLAELLQEPESVAVLRFTVAAHSIAHIIDHQHGGPWTVRGHQIPELNKHIKGAVVIVARARRST
jgi:hypothetical protein